MAAPLPWWTVDDVTRLALAAAEGDRVALHAFVRQTQVEVWRFVAGLTDRQRADDITQDVYLRALRSLAGFRAEASARTWLLGIARRTVVDSLRAAGRRQRIEDASRAVARPTAPDPTGAVDARLLVDGLAPDRREAFVLTQVLGLSYQEAAEVCDCPVGTIRSRVARARADLIGAADSSSREA